MVQSCATIWYRGEMSSLKLTMIEGTPGFIHTPFPSHILLLLVEFSR